MTARKKKKNGLGRKLLGGLFCLVLLLALGLGALIMRLPESERKDARSIARALLKPSAAPPPERVSGEPVGEQPSQATEPPRRVPDREIPPSAWNLPPPPPAEPLPMADTRSEEAIPPAPPAPFPLPAAPLAQGNPRMAQLWNGLLLHTELAPKPAAKTAVELAKLEGPVLQNRVYALSLTVPKSHQSLPALLELNGQLTNVLPSLPSLLERATVSPLYDEVYRRKVNYQRENATRLDSLLSNHNFYDTETVLQLQAPASGRRALFIQSEMDTLTDGSDGDRYPEIVGESASFQPTTSYGWPKRTKRPNPFLVKLRAQISEAERAGDKSRAASLRTKANELRNRSFLVGWIDPFIALPIFSLKIEGGFGPRIGDIAVVLYNGRAYPALVGDAGPNFKLGEASYLICQAINPSSTAMQRPESDLKVTYLVFPGTAKTPFGPPDPTDLRDRAAALLRELDPAATTAAGEMFMWPKPPEPIGYEEAVLLADVTPKTPQYWDRSSPFQVALSEEEAAKLRQSGLQGLSPEQLAQIRKATPAAK